MGLIISGVIARALGTFMMDALNALFAQAGILSRINIEMLGRVSVGWRRGHFLYSHRGEMEQVSNEKLHGYITHYLIGVGLAVPFVLGWQLFVGGPESSVWALAYGSTTTVFSYFFVFPSIIGLGVCGRRSPEGIKSALSSLANLLFYGMGMAIAFL